MIGDPCILQTPHSYGYLVGRKHKITVRSLQEARSLARRILEDPANVREIRAALSTNDSVEGLTEWLATAIYGQHYHLFVTKPATPVMEAPQVTDIKTLIVDPPQVLEGEQLVFSLVDTDFEYVPAEFTLTVAGREVHAKLDDASWREKDLGKNDEAEVLFWGIVPPPLPEDDGHGNDGGDTDGGNTEGGDGTEGGEGDGGGGITPTVPLGDTRVVVVVNDGALGCGWGAVGSAHFDVTDGLDQIEGETISLEGLLLDPLDE